MTVTDDSGVVTEITFPITGSSFTGYPGVVTDPYGNATTYSRNADNAIESVEKPNGDTWYYQHTDPAFPTQITRVTSPGGEYADVTYCQSGAASGEIASVVTKSSSGAPVSTTSYGYDSTSGRLTSVIRANKEMQYEYDGDDKTITVKECSSGTPSTVYTWTVYHYGQASQPGTGQPATNETWVTRKYFDRSVAFDPVSNTDPSKDQVTRYAYYTDSGGDRLPYIQSVTDPYNNTTSYAVDTSTGITSQITDPQGIRTQYEFDSTTKALLSTTVRKASPDNTILSREENTYYLDAGNHPTIWQRTHKDVRGHYTFYERSSSDLSLVRAIKMSAPVDGDEPDWDQVDPMERYEYYGDETTVTADATLTWDTHTDPPICQIPAGWAPNKLTDGLLGSGHEDFGEWDYGDGVLGNASYWTWASPVRITRLDLYCDPGECSACETPIAPADYLSIYGKNGSGDYVFVDWAFPTWATETWGGQTVLAAHIALNTQVTGLKLVHNSYYSFSRLGEVEISGRAVDPNGMWGQLRRQIIPDIDGTTDQVTEYQYAQDGEICNSPTHTTYQYYNGTAYESKTGMAVYDQAGRVASTTDANNLTTWYEYDALGRQTRTIYSKDNGGNPVVYTQNEYSCCTLDWSQDENGNKTYYDYDDMNRVIGTWTDVQGGSSSTNRLVAYQYDSFGNQHVVTTYSDASTPRETAYTYDKLNRVTKIVYPFETTAEEFLGDEELIYDDMGRLALKKDGNDKLTAYEYDDLGRLVGVDYEYTGAFAIADPWPNTQYFSADVSYQYDGGSSLKTSMVSGSLTSSYVYDLQGRLKTYTPPVGLGTGQYVWYDYNNAGQKAEIKITNGTTTPYDVTYDYFANGWLKEVKNLGTNVASYTYDSVGNRLTQANHNGTSTEYAYDNDDPRYFLSSITHKHGTTELGKIDYAPTGYNGRDAAGNPRSMGDWTGVWTYGYDANNRLTTAVPPNPVPDQPAGGPYEYDWVGNRIHPPADPNPMEYNAADQLLRWPGMHGADTTTHAGYVYYPDGSLHEEKNAAGTSAMKHYTYTPDGLLDEARFDYTSPTTYKTLTNTWDADRNRVGFSANSTNHTFVYDTTAGIPAVIAEDGVYCVREPDGELLARIDGSNVSHYHFDQLGSTRLLTDADGDVTDEYAYDAYGAILSHNRSTGSVDQPYQYVGQLGYYTHRQEQAFGLMQVGERYYDSGGGVFTQRDSFSVDAESAYAYCVDNVLSKVDPNGTMGQPKEPKPKPKPKPTPKPPAGGFSGKAKDCEDGPCFGCAGCENYLLNFYCHYWCGVKYAGKLRKIAQCDGNCRALIMGCGKNHCGDNHVRRGVDRKGFLDCMNKTFKEL